MSKLTAKQAAEINATTFGGSVKKSAAKKAPAKKATTKNTSAGYKAKPGSKAAEALARVAKSKKAPAKAAKKAPSKPVAKTGTYAEMQANRSATSSIENPVHAMWDLCDSMTENRRKDVIAAAVAKGINYYTARTQYQLWLTAYRNSNG